MLIGKQVDRLVAKVMRLGDVYQPFLITQTLHPRVTLTEKGQTRPVHTGDSWGGEFQMGRFQFVAEGLESGKKYRLFANTGAVEHQIAVNGSSVGMLDHIDHASEPMFRIHRYLWLEGLKNGDEVTLDAYYSHTFPNTMPYDGTFTFGLDGHYPHRTYEAIGLVVFDETIYEFGEKLELIICGGAKLDEEIISTFDSLGITILNGYGITECSPLISANRNEYRKKGSVGTPILACRVRIDDPDENGEGEICVKGPNVMLGYYNNPEATAEVFDKDGFFHTGDYGKLDDEGWIYITGRKKNLIILSNGKNVYPEEIEADLQKVEGVSEVVVYAGESEVQKDKITIVAEIFPDIDLLKDKGITDPQEYFEGQVRILNAKMPSYKSVKRVKLRDSEFQKNTSRKITRFNIDKTID